MIKISEYLPDIRLYTERDITDSGATVRIWLDYTESMSIGKWLELPHKVVVF